MKKLVLLLLLMAQAFAVSVQLQPDYVRMPVGSNQTFSIEMEGEGKVYELRLFGTYLSWQTQKVWVGPYGKTLEVTFSPTREGDYTLKADLQGEQSEATVLVYERETTDLPQRISGLRSRTSNPSVLELVDEAERLYNESRLQLAGMKLEEAESLLSKEQQPLETSSMPQFILAAVVAVVALISARMLLG